MNILAIVDRTGWCWTTTAREIASKLPGHSFSIQPPGDYDTSSVDLVWYRGYPFVCPEMAEKGVPYVFGFTTGGIREQGRMERCASYLEKASGVVVQNAASLSAVSLLWDGPVALIPNGVDTVRFSPGKPPEVFAVGMSANVGSSAKWVDKGAGDVWTACRDLGCPLRIATPRTPIGMSFDGEHLQVEHEHMPVFLQGLSVFCQPSSAEGCSNSIMEAMSCGLPCIISPTAGYHGEVCKDARDETGGEVLMVPHGSPSALRNAIKTLRDDVALRNRVSRNARRFAGLHRWDWIASLYGRVFEKAKGIAQ